jgi:hypothetical protein
MGYLMLKQVVYIATSVLYRFREVWPLFRGSGSVDTSYISYMVGVMEVPNMAIQDVEGITYFAY